MRNVLNIYNVTTNKCPGHVAVDVHVVGNRPADELGVASLKHAQLLYVLLPLCLQSAVEQWVDGGPQVVAEAGANLRPHAVFHLVSLLYCNMSNDSLLL